MSSARWSSFSRPLKTTIYDITAITTAIDYTLGTDTGDTLVTNAGDTFGESSTGGLEVVTGQSRRQLDCSPVRDIGRDIPRPCQRHRPHADL
jgi:hypothetical protein